MPCETLQRKRRRWYRKAVERSPFRDRDNGAAGDRVASLDEARKEAKVQPAAEPPKYEPVFGEGLIEV